MPAGLAVVFPRAAVSGGVERVALELLRDQGRRRGVTFVGESLERELPGVTTRLVRTGRTPSSLRPAAFRRAAASALRGTGLTTVSLGIECPPGDVRWVHSVHAAWLADGGDVVVRGHRVPSSARRVLLRHQVLLRLERSYFAGPPPRAVLCTSAREVDDLERFYGVPRGLAHVVPNGFDDVAFSPTVRSARRAAERARIGATEQDVVVLMVANEWHRKGLATLLRAVARVGDPRLRVDLVGARDPRAFVPLAAELGLRGRMRWHGPTADVAGAYSAADVFALPTAYEPFGIVIIEAMAMGLPVIVPRLAGAAEAVTSGHDGLLLDDPRDVRAVADALQTLLEHGTRTAIGARAPAAVTGYTWARVLGQADLALS